MNIEKKRHFYTLIAAAVYLIISVISLLGAVAVFVTQDGCIMKVLKNCEMPNALFCILLFIVTAFVGFTLIIANNRLCVLAHGALLLYKIVEIIYLISIDGYSKFLLLVSDILVLIILGYIVGLLFEANCLHVRYTPPKNRYFTVSLYAVFRVLKPVFDHFLGKTNFTPLQITAMIISISLFTVAFFFTVNIMVKPITTKYKQI